MSFVSVIARESFLTVMSDGRVIDRNDCIIDEAYQKFSCDEKSFIAYAGSREVCEMITRDIRDLVFNDRDYVGATLVLVQVFEQLKLESHGLKVMMALGGVNKQEEIELNTVDSIKKETLSFKPKGGDIDYAFLNNIKNNKVDFQTKLVEILKQTGIDTPSNIIQAQRLLNNYISDMDISVNKKTFRAVVKK